MALSGRRIEVSVDAVVLHGVAPADRPRAIEALRERLAEIGARSDFANGGSSVLERLDGGVITDFREQRQARLRR